MTDNPLFSPSSLPFELPDFAAIRTEHYLPAFERGMRLQREEIDAICANPEPATWENTVEAWERSGRDLERVAAVFFNLHGTDSSPEMDEIAAEVAPKLAAHADSLYLNKELYQRIKDATPPEAPESRRLHDHLLRTFVRRGAELSEEEMTRVREINARLSVLSDAFGRNLLADTRRLAVQFDDPAELEGFSPSRIESAAEDAKALGKEGYVIPLELPSVQQAQSSLDNAASRAKLYAASLQRGAETNGEVLVEMVQLRAEKAKLLGFASHADYVIAEETAGSAEAARKLLYDLAPAAATNAVNEHKLLVEAAGEDVDGADWPYWESKVRARDYQLDEGELRKYFPLDQVLEKGVFYAAKRLYGVAVEKRNDLAGYADGVDVYEVSEECGEPIGLFLTDYFGRPSKRGGAWMSGFVEQSRLLGTKPVVINVMGLTRPADGSQPLLNLDELTTVFHEFGHALHGLLSDVRYPTFSGTNVPRDYVEFPSQINENWALDPAVVRNYAFHVDTGEPIPQELLDSIEVAKQFGQGFATTEYLAAAIIDLAWHSLSPKEAASLSAADIDAFEAHALEEAGIDVAGLAPRYRSTYFNHVFAGGYSAGYYSYLWAEVLDADGFDWFKQVEAAGLGSSPVAARAAGRRFRELVLSRGASADYNQAFESLRGREKDVHALLRRRGLAGAM